MATLLEYKCPCCGGAIGFDSSIQKMKCPYCDTEFEIEALKSYDEELKKDTSDDMVWETSAGAQWEADEADSLCVYVCKSCGGEIVADDTTAATTCPYCDNPVVMAGRLSGALKPDYIIPFKLDKKAAKEGLAKHLSGKKLLPKVFKSENHIDEIKGIYIPFWLYDAQADASMRFRATRVRTWSDSNYRYTKTSHYLVKRGGTLAFERVPVDGSEKIPNELMESLEPFSFAEAVDFQTAYLAGYFADKYNVDSDSSAARANERIKKSTEDTVRSTVVGYSTVITEHSSVRLNGGKAKYALYPVWLLNTTWRDEKYTFAMNGQTGKFVGDLPLDKGAFARWFFGLTGIIGVAVFALSHLIM